MKKMFWIVTALFCFSAVNAQDEYHKMGISFDIPYGWKITDEQPEKNAIYFSCEKQGFDESGIMSFIYLHSETDLNSFLLLCMQNTENSARMNECDSFRWGRDTTDAIIGSFRGRKVTYTVSYMSLVFSGSIIVFRGCGNMVMLNPLEANEDRKKNRKGFKTILGTIKCK